MRAASTVTGRSVRRTVSEAVAGVKGLVGADGAATRRESARAPSRRRAAATRAQRRRTKKTAASA
jgi:hypothetical protein